MSFIKYKVIKLKNIYLKNIIFECSIIIDIKNLLI